MLMKVSIRKATPEDYHALCELFDEVDALHRDNLPHIFRKPDGPVREWGYYIGLLEDETVGLFVAEAENKLIAYIIAVVSDVPAIPLYVPRRCVIVDNLGVKSEFRGHGAGRLLMDTVHEWAVAKGATDSELSVYEFNKIAIAFYEKLGYKTLKRRLHKPLNNDTPSA
ncbi:MAG: N-acetyltransferase family protein [Omnitrophica WOR_2 bacterium]